MPSLTHILSLLPSLDLSLSLHPLVSSPPNLSYPTQLNPLKFALALFPSISFHYPSLLAFSALFFFFICVILAASQNSQPFSASSSFSLFHCPRHLQYLSCPSKSLFLPLSFHLGSSSNITNAIAYWLRAKSARR